MATERRAQKRSRNSAKRAGADFEIRQAEYWREHYDPRAQRRDKNGAKDLGDLDVRAYLGHELALECKNTANMNLTAAMREAQTEAKNIAEKFNISEELVLPIVLHKRHGVAAPEKQWATMEVETLIYILNLAGEY